MSLSWYQSFNVLAVYCINFLFLNSDMNLAGLLCPILEDAEGLICGSIIQEVNAEFYYFLFWYLLLRPCRCSSHPCWYILICVDRLLWGTDSLGVCMWWWIYCYDWRNVFKLNKKNWEAYVLFLLFQTTDNLEDMLDSLCILDHCWHWLADLSNSIFLLGFCCVNWWCPCIEPYMFSLDNMPSDIITTKWQV